MLNWFLFFFVRKWDQETDRSITTIYSLLTIQKPRISTRVKKTEPTFLNTSEMLKLSEGFIKKWNSRYFELKDHKLSYYPDNEKLRGTDLEVRDIQMVKILPEYQKRENVLEVRKIYYYVTEFPKQANSTFLFQLLI